MRVWNVCLTDAATRRDGPCAWQSCALAIRRDGGHTLKKRAWHLRAGHILQLDSEATSHSKLGG